MLICGDRNWQKRGIIRRILLQTKPSCVIQGEARGADTIAKQEAMNFGIPVMGFPAQWDYYGRKAGPIRNSWMLEFGMPDRVIAFHADIENSKGTKDMVTRAGKAGIPTSVITG